MKPSKYQIWKDNDSAVTRYVQVTGNVDQWGRVEITTILRSNGKFDLPQVIENGMVTYPRADRFNNKSDGYTFIANNLKTLNEKHLHLIHHAEMLSKRSQAAAVEPIAVAVSMDIGFPNTPPKIAIGIRDEQPMFKPEMGQIWRELKGSCLRFVQIVGEKVDGKVQIITRYYTKTVGARAQATPDAKPTLAMENRFDGKSSGYEFVCDNLTDLLSGDYLKSRFVPMGQTEESILDNMLKGIEPGQVLHDTYEQTCFHLVKIVGFNTEHIELATSYVGETDASIKKPKKLIAGKSTVMSIEDFLAEPERFVMVQSA